MTCSKRASPKFSDLKNLYDNASAILNIVSLILDPFDRLLNFVLFLNKVAVNVRSYFTQCEIKITASSKAVLIQLTSCSMGGS